MPCARPHRPGELLMSYASYRIRSVRLALTVLLGLHGLVTVAAARAQEEGRLQEIIVTAEKRKESLQTTPISITALTARALEARQIDRLEGIAAATPNLMIDTATSLSGTTTAAGIFIRGIGQSDFTLTTDPGVGVYLDGVYIANSMGSLLDVTDVERVEVLRGPQGTLFGRNTIGGAINVTSTPPGKSFSSDLKVTTGSYGRFDVLGHINVPLSDTLFARLSAATFNQRGFLDAPNTESGNLGGVDREAARLALRWVPGGRLEASFTADYNRTRENGAPAVRVASYQGASLALISSLSNPASPSYSPPPAPLPAPSFIDLYNVLATTPIGEQGGIAGVTPGVVPNPIFGQPTLGPQNDETLSGRLVNLSNMNQHGYADIWGTALTLDYDLGSAALKSITSYRSMSSFTPFDFGAIDALETRFADTTRENELSEELQLSGNAVGGRLDWLAGLYYFRETGLNLNDVEFTAVRILSGADVDNHNEAAFSQATFKATDKLSLTAGLRFTEETKRFIVPTTCYPLPLGPATLFGGAAVTCAPLQTVIDPGYLNPGFLAFTNAPVYPAPGGRLCCIPVSNPAGEVVGWLPGLESGSQVLPRGTTTKTFVATTPHADIAYQWTRELMTYASYSVGYKSGGFVQRVFPPMTGVPTYNPETADVYELGFKWDGLDSRARLDGSVFHTNYRNMQVEVNDGIAPVTRNAAAAKIDGAELELTIVPARGWLIESSVGYLDARYTQLDAGQNFSYDLRTITLESGLVDAPRWSISQGAQYQYSLPGGAMLRPRVDWSYRSLTYKDALNTPQLTQGGYGLLDLSLTYATATDALEITAFGKNVTDKIYIVSGYANGLTEGHATAIIGAPAEWGLSLAYHFGD